MNRHLIIAAGAIAIAVIALASLLYASSLRGTTMAAVEIVSGSGETTRLSVEIAGTADEQERGLMNRTALARDAGMLFVFSGNAQRYFWMENTQIPLDMIFISDDLVIVGVHENATPLSREVIASTAPCMYVLEVNGGLCQEREIRVGDKVRLEI